ncbi:MAG: hypothetical protein IJQ06_04250 [Paludibacteraceae bacterium]|nr:hypothetical protein [Paludibacteraceae bacterium]
MKEIMKKPLFLIWLLAGVVLSLGAAPTYTMRSCAPMQGGVSASACPRIGYTTAPASSYRAHSAAVPAYAHPYTLHHTPYTPAASYAPMAAYSPSFGPRRAPGYDGTYEGQEEEDGGKYWMWDGEGWIETGSVPVGTTKIVDGITYTWDGSAWVVVSDQQDPGLPLGDTPWFWMLLLAAGYAALKMSLRVKELKSLDGR